MASLSVILVHRARVKGAVLPSRWSAAGRTVTLPVAQ